MLSLRLFFDLFDLSKKHDDPPADVNQTRYPDLYADAGVRGTVITGDPATGKTRFAADQLIKRFKANPKLSVFVFDWSGGITNTILDIISRDPNHEKLLDRVILDEFGNEKYIVPTPEFHPDYGLSDEEQVARVVGNMQKFAEFMAKTAPFLVGVSVREIAKHLFRLLTVIRNQHGESWQIIEALDLLTDQALLKRALQKYGQYAMPSKLYFEKQYLPEKVMPQHEKEITTRALRFLLGMIDSKEVRATLGHYEPMWTPKMATENGMMVLIDAHKMINTPEAQHYLIVQSFSLVMHWINKREVDDPQNERIILALDETYALLRIEGFAEWLSMISPLYRSRATELVYIIQGLWQLDDRLKEQLWSTGQIISFRNDNPKEALELARGLFSYDYHYVKNTPKTDNQNPTTESQDGQDRMNADFIQNLKHRQFIMRRYKTERDKEGIIFVKKTPDLPTNPPDISVKEIKEKLLRKYGVSIREAINVITERSLEVLKEEQKKKDEYNSRGVS